MITLKQTKSRGFTIVELLIVIVVIAILAAITIVAYNGIQNRAKTSAGQAGTNVLIKKVAAFNTVNSAYPSYCQLITNSLVPTGTAPVAPATGVGSCAAGGANAGGESKLDNTASYMLATDNIGAGYTQAVSNNNAIIGYYLCGTNTGANIYYWDFTTSSVKEVSSGAGC